MRLQWLSAYVGSIPTPRINNMKSITHLKKQTAQKTHPELVATIHAARRQKEWFGLAARLSGPTRRYAAMNLDEIDSKTKEGDTVVVPGKVLSMGSMRKKIRIAALFFSTAARAKLQKSKSEIIPFT